MSAPPNGRINRPLIWFMMVAAAIGLIIAIGWATSDAGHPKVHAVPSTARPAAVMWHNPVVRSGSGDPSLVDTTYQCAATLQPFELGIGKHTMFDGSVFAVAEKNSPYGGQASVELTFKLTDPHATVPAIIIHATGPNDHGRSDDSTQLLNVRGGDTIDDTITTAGRVYKGTDNIYKIDGITVCTGRS